MSRKKYLEVVSLVRGVRDPNQTIVDVQASTQEFLHVRKVRSLVDGGICSCGDHHILRTIVSIQPPTNIRKGSLRRLSD